MLTLILGRAKSGKTTMLLDQVKNCAAMGMAQRIVIVPEQLSHGMEQLLSKQCGDEISFTTEVLSFTRMYSRVCSMYGGGARQTLDQGGRILTARLAMDGIVSRLKIFAPAAGKAEFLSSVVNMIDELKSYDITPQMLAQAAKLTEGTLAGKLEELALILGAYDAAVSRSAADPRDCLTILAKKLAQQEYAVGRHFFVDGFTDYTAQELSVLHQLMRRGEQMTVTIPCDDLLEGERLFEPGRETALRLKSMAESMGQEVVIRKANYDRQIPPELKYLEQNLLGYRPEQYGGQCGAITVVQAESILDECRKCAATIKKHAMEGMRLRDMRICVSDEATYEPVLRTVFQSMNLPLDSSRKRKVLEHPAVSFISLALEAALEGMEAETVCAYLKTGYSGIDEDTCDALENYAVVWQIRGTKWTKPWTMHPEGYDGRFTDETETRLAELNAMRAAAVQPLTNLRKRIRAAGNTLAQVEAIYRFLEETNLFQQLTEQVEADTQQGLLEAAQETAQIWQKLLACLQQMADVLGETCQKERELLRIFRLALNQYEVGTIPSTLDSVAVGTISAARGNRMRLLYVLGANDGLLPRGGGNNGLLTDYERGVLKEELQLNMAPDGAGQLERELFQIYSALTAPTERLYLSWAEEKQGAALQPSYLATRISGMFPWSGYDTYTELEYTAETAAEQYLSSMGQPEHAALTASIGRAAGEIPELRDTIARGKELALERNMIVDGIHAGAMFGQPVALTASKLDELGNCPLSFFLQYGIRAKERKPATFGAAEYGSFIHYVFQHGVNELVRRGEKAPLAPEESMNLVRKYMKRYVDEERNLEERTERQSYLFDRNRDEAAILMRDISEELFQSDFVPCAYELYFGNEKQPPLTAEGKLGWGTLTGLVDRADLWKGPEGDFIRIVDYKSGTKKFDYTDIYGGVGMQMLLYLFALEKSGLPGIAENPIPAGVLYYPAKSKFNAETDPERVDGPELEKRTGLVLDEEPVIWAMEHSDKPKYIPVKRSKTKGGLGDYAVSREQMEILNRFVTEKMGDAVDRILGGGFIPKPYYRGTSHDPCGWCKFGDICQKDQNFRKQHYQETMKAAEFWEKIGGETDGE